MVSSGFPDDIVQRATEIGIDGFADKGDPDASNLLCKQQTGKVVVLIDDSNIATSETRTLLEAFGAKEVHEYNDPLLALQKIPNLIPPADVIFVDYKMPRMKGDEVVSRLRSGDRQGL